MPEEGEFDIDDVLNALNAKTHTPVILMSLARLSPTMRRKLLRTGKGSKTKWKAATRQPHQPWMESQEASRHLNAPSRFSTRAAEKGFDWPDHNGPRSKITEELEEIACACSENCKEEEIGDLIFAVINYARHFNIDPSIALSRSNQKFEQQLSPGGEGNGCRRYINGGLVELMS